MQQLSPVHNTASRVKYGELTSLQNRNTLCPSYEISRFTVMVPNSKVVGIRDTSGIFVLALSFRDVLRRMPRTYSLEQRDAPTGHLRCFPWVGPVALEPWRLELGHLLRRETMSRRCTTATRKCVFLKGDKTIRTKAN